MTTHKTVELIIYDVMLLTLKDWKYRSIFRKTVPFWKKSNKYFKLKLEFYSKKYAENK